MGGQNSLKCVPPERLVKDIPYVIITLDSEEQTELVSRQCNSMRVQARSYKELIRERCYLTSWNRIDYPMLYLSCVLKGNDIGEELRRLKLTTGKKIMMFYGNCQSTTLNAIALTSKKLGEKYFIIVLPPVQNLSANERENGINQGVLENLDVLFYQHINYSNNFGRLLASDIVTRGMSHDNQVKICIPNVYYDGYFPQFKGNRYQPTGMGGYAVGAGPFTGDENIEKMWDACSVEEIYEKLSDEGFYNADAVKKKANASLEELKRREEICDVIISDYIRENFRHERLFFIPNHPKVKVIHELLRRAFVKIGIDADDMRLDNIQEPDMQVVPIYPSVSKALGLDFVDDICYEPSLPERPSDLSQYVAAYVKYCKPLWEREKNF